MRFEKYYFIEAFSDEILKIPPKGLPSYFKDGQTVYPIATKYISNPDIRTNMFNIIKYFKFRYDPINKVWFSTEKAYWDIVSKDWPKAIKMYDDQTPLTSINIKKPDESMEKGEKGISKEDKEKSGIPAPTEASISRDFKGRTIYQVNAPWLDDENTRNIRNAILKHFSFFWNANEKKWATTNKDNFELVTKNWDDAVKQYKSKFLQTQANIEKSKALNADIDVPTPEGKAYLPYQKAGISRALEIKNVLIGDEMGLGKTMQAIGIAQMTKPEKMLVICPAGLRINWIKEWLAWDTTKTTLTLISMNKILDKKLSNKAQTLNPKDITELPKGIIIAGYETVSKYSDLFRKVHWNILVVDESHKLKNEKSARAKSIFGLKTWEKTSKKEIEIEKPIKADRTILLTGSPIPNDVKELVGTVKRLDPDGLGKNTWHFLNKYTNVVQTQWGTTFEGGKNQEELQRKMRDTFMIRRNKADALKELPKKERKIIELTPTGNIVKLVADENKLYQAMQKFDSHEKKAAFTELSKIRHALGLSKVNDAVTEANKILNKSDKQKIVIMCHHNDVAKKIAENLSRYKPILITGEIPFNKRNENQSNFQENPEYRVAVCTIMAAGVGLTLTAASIMIFVELDWVPGNIQQAEDRIHRIGQKMPVSIHYLVYNDSVDARMLNIITQKSITQAKVLDADELKDTFDADDITSSTTVIDLPKNTKPPAIDSKTNKILPLLKPDEKETILKAVQHISSYDTDRAIQRNDVGFNKMDSYFGNLFANGAYDDELSYWKALRMIRKYARQLGDVSKLDAILTRGRKESIDADEYNENTEKQTEESYNYLSNYYNDYVKYIKTEIDNFLEK